MTRIFGLTAAVAIGAAALMGGVPAPAQAQKVIKMGHLNNDDPFENPAGAFGRRTSPGASRRCRPPSSPQADP